MLREIKQARNEELEPLLNPGEVSGFKSPAADYEQERLNILEKLVSDPINTYFFEATNDDMELFAIKTNSLLVVDRSKRASGGMIVVAWHEDKWVCRQLIIHGKNKYLTTAKEEEPFIEIKEPEGTLIFGVVTWSCCPQMEVKKYARSGSTCRLQ